MQSYNVTIIGAGPAGAIAALLCARSGLKTLVVEKKKLPRSKSCAGGITARALRLLRDIHCVNDLPFERLIHQLMIHYPQTGKSCELISTAPYLGTVRRTDFDMTLVELAADAGAEIREAESFTGYSRKTHHHVDIRTDKSVLSTNILIGADGFHSQVRRQMQRENPGAYSPPPMMFGIECDILADQMGNLSPEHCHLFFNIGKRINYGWAFPKKTSFNVGMVLDAGNSPKTIQSAKPVHQLELFLKKISGNNVIWNRVGAAPLPLFGAIKNPVIQKDNVLLVGDAAGFADAWTGEGIYYSIKSAMLATHVIQAVLIREKGFDYLKTYSDLCRKLIGRELKMSYRVSVMFKKMPSFYDFLQYPKVRQLFVPHTQGEISYQRAMIKAFLLINCYKLRLLNPNKNKSASVFPTIHHLKKRDARE